MKKVLSIILTITIFIGMNVTKTNAFTNKGEEMRGAWVTTVYNSDWPSSQSKNNVQMQKQELISILDDLKGLGFNTIVLQVRPKGDALYNSSINPWSDVLTGVQGKDPGYDPLKFAIDEAHKRGMEIHAWLNPYRITTSGTNLNALSENHFARKNPNLVINYNNALYYNPGMPEVRKHISDTVEEIVRNYNVDGIHFDDYFYPGKDVEDSEAYNLYGNGRDIGDFRRDNVNIMVRDVYNKIKSINKNVQFGISPRGIWKNKSSDPTGSDTKGGQSYYDIYADTRTWIKNGWIDYVTPQIYWEIGNSAADYSKLLPWWSNEVRGTNVDLYIGQGIYKDTVAKETDAQLRMNKNYNEIKGSMFFSYSDIKNNRQGVRDRIKRVFNETLPPIDTNKNGVVYQSHVQDIGWQNWVSNGQVSGTSGQAKRVEGIRLYLNNSIPNANIVYRTHIQDIGWQAWKRNGELSGTQGQSKRIEGLEIKLENAPGYSIEYRAHVQDFGWQPWKKDGELAGTSGQSKRIEAYEVRIVKQGEVGVEYQTHVQDFGWQQWSKDGAMAGTTGQSKRLEGIKIKVNGLPSGAKVKYSTHVQDIGWMNWVYDGGLSGTEGRSKRLEGIKIQLENAPGYSVEYRVHIQDIGWQEWKKDGVLAGTTGQSKRLEGIEIKIIKQ
ncbi:MAG: family 10 glycosylhydrolase [Clostridium sp.]